MYNFLGVPMYVGTYCQEIKPDNQAILFGFAQQGTIEVKCGSNNNNYEFVIDYTTPEGVSIKGLFLMGEVQIIDNSLSLPGGDWYSIVHEDKSIIFDKTDDVYALRI